jgi:tetrahydromethanopterin S-methyltransferase subunit H
MRDLTPLEVELDNLKRHNSYLAFRITHAVSTGELRMLEAAMKVNDEGISSIEAELGLNVNA